MVKSLDGTDDSKKGLSEDSAIATRTDEKTTENPKESAEDSALRSAMAGDDQTDDDMYELESALAADSEGKPGESKAATIADKRGAPAREEVAEQSAQLKKPPEKQVEYLDLEPLLDGPETKKDDARAAAKLPENPQELLKELDSQLPRKLAENQRRQEEANEKRSQESLFGSQINALNLRDSLGRIRAGGKDGDQPSPKETEIVKTLDQIEAEQIRALDRQGDIQSLRLQRATMLIGSGTDDNVRDGEKQLTELIRDYPGYQTDEKFHHKLIATYSEMAVARQLRNLPEWKSALQPADVLGKSDPESAVDADFDPIKPFGEANKLLKEKGLKEALPAYEQLEKDVNALRQKTESARIGSFLEVMNGISSIAQARVKGENTELAESRLADLVQEEESNVVKAQRNTDIKASLNVKVAFSKIASADENRFAEGKKELLECVKENPYIVFDKNFQNHLDRSFKEHYESLPAKEAGAEPGNNVTELDGNAIVELDGKSSATAGDGKSASTVDGGMRKSKTNYTGIDANEIDQIYSTQQPDRPVESRFVDDATTYGLTAGLIALNIAVWRIQANLRHNRQNTKLYGVDAIESGTERDRVIRDVRDPATSKAETRSFEVAGVTRDLSGGVEQRQVVLKNPYFNETSDKDVKAVENPENFNPRKGKFGPAEHPYKPIKIGGEMFYARDGVVHSYRDRELKPTSQYSVMPEKEFIRNGLPEQLERMAQEKPGEKGLAWSAEYIKGRIARTPEVTMFEIAKELTDMAAKQTGDKTFAQGLTQAAEAVQRADQRSIQVKDKPVAEVKLQAPVVEAVEPPRFEIKGGTLRAEGDLKAWLKEEPSRIFDIARQASEGDVRAVSSDIRMALKESAQHLKGMDAQKLYDGLKSVLDAEKAAVVAEKPVMGLKLLFDCGVTAGQSKSKVSDGADVARGARQYRPAFYSAGKPADTAPEKAWPGITYGVDNRAAEFSWLVDATAKWSDGAVHSEGLTLSVGDTKAWLQADPTRVFDVIDKAREGRGMGLELLENIESCAPDLKSVPQEELIRRLSGVLTGSDAQAKPAFNVLAASGVLREALPEADMSSLDAARRWSQNALVELNAPQEKLGPLPRGITETPVMLDGADKYLPKGTLRDGRVWLTHENPNHIGEARIAGAPRNFDPANKQYAGMTPVNLDGKEVYVDKNNKVFSYHAENHMLISVDRVKVRTAGDIAYELNQPPNPYERQYRIMRQHADRSDAGEGESLRQKLGSKYSWSGIPTQEAIKAIYDFANRPGSTEPGKLVSIGAGSGYWENIMEKMGLDLDGAKYDIAPPEKGENREYHWDKVQYTSIAEGGHEKLQQHGNRTLFLSWPEAYSPMAADTLKAYIDAAGETGGRMVFIGEQPDVSWEGRSAASLTGNLEFFTMLDREFKLVGEAPLGTVEFAGNMSTLDKVYFYERRPLSERVDARSTPLTERARQNFINEKAEHLNAVENRVVQTVKESVLASDQESIKRSLDMVNNLPDPARRAEVLNRAQSDFARLGLNLSWHEEPATNYRLAGCELSMKDRQGVWEVKISSVGKSSDVIRHQQTSAAKPILVYDQDLRTIMESQVSQLSDRESRYSGEAADKGAPQTRMQQFIESRPAGWDRSDVAIQDGKGPVEFKALQLLREGVVNKDSASLRAGLNTLFVSESRDAVVEQFKQEMKPLGIEVSKFELVGQFPHQHLELVLEDVNKTAKLSVSNDRAGREGDLTGAEKSRKTLQADSDFDSLSKKARLNFGETGEPIGYQPGTARSAVEKTSDPKVIAEGQRILEEVRSSLTKGKVDPKMVELLRSNTALLASLPAEQIHEGLVKVVREYPSPAVDLLKQSGVLNELIPGGNFKDVNHTYQCLDAFARENNLLYDEFSERGIRVRDGAISTYGDMGQWLRDQPKRLLDVARIAARDNISLDSLDSGLVNAFEKNRIYSRSIDSAFVHQAVKDVLNSRYPQAGLELLRETGVLATVFPDGKFKTVQQARDWAERFEPHTVASSDRLIQPIVSQLRNSERLLTPDEVTGRENAIRFIDQVTRRPGFNPQNKWMLSTLSEMIQTEAGDWSEESGSRYNKGRVLNDVFGDLQDQLKSMPSKTALSDQGADVATKVRQALNARGITGAAVNSGIGMIFAAQTDPDFDHSRESYDLLAERMKQMFVHQEVLEELNKQVETTPEIKSGLDKAAGGEPGTTDKSASAANSGEGLGKGTEARPLSSEEKTSLESVRKLLAVQAPDLDMSKMKELELRSVLSAAAAQLPDAERKALEKLLADIDTADGAKRSLMEHLGVKAETIAGAGAERTIVPDGAENLTIRGVDHALGLTEISEVKDYVARVEAIRKTGELQKILIEKGMDKERAQKLEKGFLADNAEEKTKAAEEIDKFYNERIAERLAEAARTGNAKPGESGKEIKKGTGMAEFAREAKGRLGSATLVLAAGLPFVLYKAMQPENDDFGGATFER